MCFVAAPVLSLVATGLSAGGALIAGYQAQQAADYNAEVARNNARAAMQKAGFEAGLIRERGEETISAGKAALGKAGVDLTSGSATAALGRSAQNTEMDALATIYSGRLEANAQKAAAQLYKAQGQQAMIGGVIKAAGTLLTPRDRRTGRLLV